MQILNPETFDYRISIGVQSTAYSGPLDPKWKIEIGSGIGLRRRKYFLIYFADKLSDNGFLQPRDSEDIIASYHRPTRYIPFQNL